MMGYGAVVLALIVTVFAAICYFAAANCIQNGKQKLAGNARLLYVLSVGMIGVAAIYLMYILVGNRFDYAYVFSYSARDLPLVYKVSAFWAGQEGSLLLWLTFHAAFGLVLVRKPSTPMQVMAVLCLIQSAFLVLLLVKSPFMMLAEPRIDGAGLNPLLQDPWMVIHPPVLFLGYAALAVPFAYGVGAMLTGRHQEWLDTASAWTLFALSSLGSGMFIGGFWAYKVLGWGGYWAWDPVENSSLVPWLGAGALAHLLVIAKVRAGAVKQAYAGVICNFILVLYGTFLTRSGVLSDFSTHSFADEGTGGYLGLIVLVTAFSAFVIYIIKWTGMPSGELYSRLASREFVLALTAFILAFFGVLVFVGMSTPLVTMALGSPKSVSSVFYTNVTLPLAIAIVAALTAGPLFMWGNGLNGRIKQQRWIGLLLTGGLPVVAWLKLSQPLFVVIICLATAVVGVNGYAAYTKRMSWAAACSHIGVAVMIAGIIASTAASQSATIAFVQGQPQEVFGQPVSYAGTQADQSGKRVYNTFHVGHNQAVVHSLTKLNKEGMPAAREPGIYRSMLSDLYITPNLSEEADVAGAELTLVKGQPLSLDGVNLNFIRLTTAGMDGSSEVRIQAIIEVSAEGQTQQIKPELTNKNGRIIGTSAFAFGRYEVHIAGIRPGEGKVIIELKDNKTQVAAGAERLEAEVSRKPLINLVWLGAFMIAVGTGWAGVIKRVSHRQLVARQANEDANRQLELNSFNVKESR